MNVDVEPYTAIMRQLTVKGTLSLHQIGGTIILLPVLLGKY